MTKTLLLLFFIIAWSNIGYGQGSTVPDSVRAMIEREQAASRYEQTARMQVSVQFGEFLESFASDEQRATQIETALIEVLSERAELSSRVTTGQASADQLETISNYTYLRGHLAPLLNSVELALLDSLRDGPSDAQLKKDYAEELSRIATDLTEVNRELVLNTLIKHLRSGQTANANRQLNLDALVMQQSRSLMRAREELQSQLSGEQLLQTNVFLDQLQASLYRNRSMSDAAQ